MALRSAPNVDSGREVVVDATNPIAAPIDSTNPIDSMVAVDSPVDHTCLDHFIVRDGVEFAGMHVIIDLWQAARLDDLALMESTLRKVVDVCGATLLHLHLHHFTPNLGISGVAVLAESHISVHTWPERDYAAFDVFMCGDARPERAVGILCEAFGSPHADVKQIRRGVVAATDWDPSGRDGC